MAACVSIGLDDLDEGYFIEHAARVLAGQVPYRDFESLYTPGLTYLHAAVFAVAGEPSIALMRWVAWLARAAVVCLMYLLARPIMPPLWAVVAPLFVLVGLDPAPDRWNTHPGWPSAAAGLLTVWTMAHWSVERRRSAWLIAAGAAAGLTFVFKQNAGVFVSIACGLFVIVRTRETAVRSLLWLAAGFVIVTLPWLIPLVAALGGDLRPLAHFVGAVDTGPLFYGPEPLNALALAAMAAAIILVVRTRATNDAWRLRWYLIGGCALFLTQYPRMDTMHLAWSAPLLLVLGAAFLSRLPWVWATLGCAIVAACALPMLTYRIESVMHEPLVTVETVPVARGLRVPAATRSNVEGVVDDLRSRTMPGEPIFVYPTSPLLYVAAGRPNPTRYAHLYPGAASAAEIDELVRQLDASSVRTVIVDDFWLGIWTPPGPNQPLLDALNANFQEVARFGAYRVLVRSVIESATAAQTALVDAGIPTSASSSAIR